MNEHSYHLYYYTYTTLFDSHILTFSDQVMVVNVSAWKIYQDQLLLYAQHELLLEFLKEQPQHFCCCVKATMKKESLIILAAKRFVVVLRLLLFGLPD